MRNYKTAIRSEMPGKILWHEVTENISRQGAFQGEMRNYKTAIRSEMPERFYGTK